jgi:3-hydroxy acid dehydrogenase / malonic semialdehyde reductase
MLPHSSSLGLAARRATLYRVDKALPGGWVITDGQVSATAGQGKAQDGGIADDPLDPVIIRGADVAQTLINIAARRLIEDRLDAKTLYPPAQLAGGRRANREVDEVEGHSPLFEESLRLARRLRLREPEQLNLRHSRHASGTEFLVLDQGRPMLVDTTVLITGASSGIGRSCARAFAEAGARLLLCARRAQRLQELAAELKSECFTFTLDVRDREATQAAIAGLPPQWQAIDVLVNNAGLAAGLAPLHEGDVDDWDRMIDTNVRGLLNVTRPITRGMVERGSGHVINIGSIAGHEAYPGGAVYCATKAAVAKITAGLRMDLLGTGVRVSTVDPGLVETEFSIVRFHGDYDRAATVYEGLTPLTPDDIAETIVWIADRPPHVQIAEVIILPTAQASATRTARR